RREVRVQPRPHLVRAVARHVGEQGAERGAIDAVALGHAGSTSRVKARSVRWTLKPRCSYIVTAAVLPPSTYSIPIVTPRSALEASPASVSWLPSLRPWKSGSTAIT